MDTIVKLSIWAVIVVLVGGQLNHILQNTMIEAGIISKKVEISDACKFDTLPKWFKDVLQCEQANKPTTPVQKTKPKLKMTLDLDKDLLQEIRFENREKTLIDKVVDYVNKAFAYLQRLVLPEKFVLPCILGDCNMDKKIKLEKEKYSNLIGRKVPVTKPDEDTDLQKKHQQTKS